MSDFLRQLTRKKPVDLTEYNKAADDTTLKKSLTTLQLAALGIGSTIGTGIFIVLNSADTVALAGPAVIISFIFAGLAAAFTALCYAELTSLVPIAGSSYSYAYVTLGELAAIFMAGCLLLEYGVSAAAVAVGWSEYVNNFLTNIHLPAFPDYLSASPWESGYHGIINLPAVILVGLCSLLLLRGTSESAKTNLIMVFIKIAVLIIFTVIAFTAFKASNFHPFATNGTKGIMVASGAIFFSYIGLDTVATGAAEVKNPQRQLPKAMIIACGTVIIVYLLVAIAAVGAQPAEKFADPNQQKAGLAKILENVTGNTGSSIIFAIGAIISIFSVTLVTIYAQTRILYVISKDGMLPKRFQKVDPATQVPVFNTIVVSIAIALLAGFAPMQYLQDTVSIGSVVAFVFVAIGVIILRIRQPHLTRTFKLPFGILIPVLAILSCVYILAGLHWRSYLSFILWSAIVIIFYLIWGRKNSQLP